MAFTWATNITSEVSEPSVSRKAEGYHTFDKPPAGEFNWLFQQVAAISADRGYIFEAVGRLTAMVGRDIGAVPVPYPLTIAAIRLTCPTSPPSGTITVTLFRVTPGGSPVALYTGSPLPALTCNGGYASVLSANIPDLPTVPAGDLLIARIAATPGDAHDLTISVI